MTLQTASDIIFRRLGDNKNENVIEALRTIDDVNHKQKKYRWHNLCKNPDDLPERDGNDETEYVLCLIGNQKWNHCEQAYYHHGKKQWSTYDQNVIAWRYIEPFEDVEK